MRCLFAQGSAPLAGAGLSCEQTEQVAGHMSQGGTTRDLSLEIGQESGKRSVFALLSVVRAKKK
jgi:hypothetical protein